jgi:hypothetical protein
MTNARLVVKNLVISKSVAALVLISQSPITAIGTVTVAKTSQYGAQTK